MSLVQKNTSHFLYDLKLSDDLTENEIEGIFQFTTRIHPVLKEYYEQNRYYSSVKPNMVLRVWDGNDRKNMIAFGKLLWFDLDLAQPVGKVRFSVFGVVVDDDYHRMGIGKNMLEKCLEEARARKADLMFITTKNPVAKLMFEKQDFENITATITWKDAITGKTVDVAADGLSPYGYCIKKEIVNSLNSLPSIHLGTGPL